MKTVRLVLAALLAGAAAGVVGALLRPRRMGAVSGYDPAAPIGPPPR